MRYNDQVLAAVYACSYPASMAAAAAAAATSYVHYAYYVVVSGTEIYLYCGYIAIAFMHVLQRAYDIDSTQLTLNIDHHQYHHHHHHHHHHHLSLYLIAGIADAMYS